MVKQFSSQLMQQLTVMILIGATLVSKVMLVLFAIFQPAVKERQQFFSPLPLLAMDIYYCIVPLVN